MTEAQNPILETLERAITHEGGIAEAVEPYTIRALLSEEMAQTLNVSTELRLTTKAGDNQADFVTFDSPLLLGFSDRFALRGALAALRIAYPGHMKNAGFEQALASTISIGNGLLRMKSARPADTTYLQCTTAYTAAAEEKRQGKCIFILNTLTGAAPLALGDALLWEADQSEQRSISLGGAVDLPLLERCIADVSERLVRSELEMWMQRLARRLVADEERLQTYYAEIIDEIHHRIIRRGLLGDIRKREEDRIQATERERDRKISEVRARYGLRIEHSLQSVLAITIPTVHIRCEIVRKRLRREITAVWNPFTKLVEPLRCEAENTPANTLFLQDDESLVCRRCHSVC